ncbi:MAG: ABC transporter permease [Candidatus Thorarchaeota archaeon]
MSMLSRLMPDRKMKYLVKKELKSLFRSRWLIFGLIISPVFAWLFEGAFLSFVVAQTTSEPSRVFITLEDEGVWGQTLYDAIESDMDELLISELLDITKQEGDEMVANRTLSVWVRIPANFTQELEYNNVSTMVIWVNTGNFRATAAGNRVAGFAREVIDEIIVIRDLRVSWRTISPEATYGHSLAVFLVMIVSVMAPSPYIGQSFAGEREKHTLEALLVVPMSRVRILVAKLFAGLALTMVYSAFTVVGILLYNWSIIARAVALPPAAMDFYINLYTVNIAAIPLIFFCQLLILLCAISIGIVISSAAKDQATAESINNLVLLVPTMVIGILGFTGSILQYGGLFGIFVLAIPFSHAVLFLNGVLSGAATAASLMVNIAYMLGFAIVFLIIGAKLFEREAIIV